MRLIEAVGEIERAMQERGEVASIDYTVLASGSMAVECRVNFASGEPLELRIDLSGPVDAATLPREELSQILRCRAPRPSVH